MAFEQNNFKLFGDWGLGIGDWGLGIGPNPQSPILSNQSPVSKIYFINNSIFSHYLTNIKINILNKLKFYNQLSSTSFTLVNILVISSSFKNSLFFSNNCLCKISKS